MMLWIELIPVVAALLCFAAALGIHLNQKKGIRHPIYTEATIVGEVTQTHYHNRSEVMVIAPKVRYMTEQGEQLAASRHFMPEWQYRYHRGDKIRICYQRENPGLFRICRTNGEEWCRNGFLVAGVGILLAYAVLRMQYH